MSDPEFLTVTTYNDAVVPDWVVRYVMPGGPGDVFKDIKRAFKAGVEAAMNLECKGVCSGVVSVNSAPKVFYRDDNEPDRTGKYLDKDGDLWTYDRQWGYQHPGHGTNHYGVGQWDNLTVEDAFPLTEVVPA